jgi:hypothetical protein
MTPEESDNIYKVIARNERSERRNLKLKIKNEKLKIIF